VNPKRRNPDNKRRIDRSPNIFPALAQSDSDTRDCYIPEKVEERSWDKIRRRNRILCIVPD
jgi:hypothetical protein